MVAANSDESTIEGFLKGDRDATRTIEQHVESAFRVWQGKFGYDADDIRSDVYYKLLISFRRGEFGFRSSLRTYVSRVVSHTCIDYLRFHKRFSPVDLDDIPLQAQSPTAEERLEKRQEGKLVFRTLRLLPAECRQLFRMYVKQDMKCREIGEIMGKTEGNIRRRLWACRQTAIKIREKLLKRGKRF